MTIKSKIAFQIASTFPRPLTPDDLEIIDQTLDLCIKELVKIEELEKTENEPAPVN